MATWPCLASQICPDTTTEVPCEGRPIPAGSTSSGWVYVAFVADIFSCFVVGS